MEIPFNEPYATGAEVEYIDEGIRNGHLSGNGPFVRRCQEWRKSIISCREALLTHSGTEALEMAAILVNKEPGDEIIMPSFTFVFTANAFVLRGAVPVLSMLVLIR
jgi:dTDP-4-amino-4,6-dideoxygalactose transaminase